MNHSSKATLTRRLKDPRTGMAAFRLIPDNKQGFVLLDLPKSLSKKLMESLKNEELVKILNYLDPDGATELLHVLNRFKRAKIFRALGEHIRDKVEFLLKFGPKTAAGMMSLDYIEADKNATIAEALKWIQKHEKQTGKIPTVLVVQDGFLIGELSIHQFALAKKSAKVHRHIRHIPSIQYDKEEHEIIDTFRKHPHGKIVVLDEGQSILGVIYSDDILKLLHDQSTKSLRDFAGVRKEENVRDSAMVKVRYRYHWLIINLATAFLAAAVVGLFEDIISSMVLLAAYLPIVAGMGGNAATQTLAVTVRGLALKEINFSNGKRVILNEVIAGVVNGAITGLLAAGVATFWNKSPKLGLVIGMAMVINLFVAGFFGTLIPLVMQKLGKDPASSATIFITTATDVFGFVAFLGLATLILK